MVGLTDMSPTVLVSKQEARWAGQGITQPPACVIPPWESSDIPGAGGYPAQKGEKNRVISITWSYGDRKPLPKKFLSMVSPGLEQDIVRIEKCECGEERVIWVDDHRDAWKNHFDYCNKAEGDES